MLERYCQNWSPQGKTGNLVEPGSSETDKSNYQ